MLIVQVLCCGMKLQKTARQQRIAEKVFAAFWSQSGACFRVYFKTKEVFSQQY